MKGNRFMLQGKKGLVIGVANDQSIAYAAAKLTKELGAEVVATCLNDKARKYVEPVLSPLHIPLLNCNVEIEGELEATLENAAEILGKLTLLFTPSLLHLLMICMVIYMHLQQKGSNKRLISPAIHSSEQHIWQNH